MKTLKANLYYYTGLTFTVICILIAELIWLPAPLRTNSGVQWIEMIDWLFYGLAIIPLSWLIGAVLAIRSSRKGLVRESFRQCTGKRGAGYLAFVLLRSLIVGTGAFSAGVVFAAPERLELMIGAIIIAAVLVIVDLLLTEVVQRKTASVMPSEGYLPGADDGRRQRGFRRYFPWKGVCSLLLMAAVMLTLLYPIGYRVTYPGMTLGMNRYAHAEGGQSEGRIDGVLVFERPAVLADRLFGELLPMYDFEKIPEGQPPFTESYAQVAAMKTDANALAAAVAMGKAGIGTGVTTIGVRIVAIVQDSPADGRLQAGDRIIELDGHSVANIAELSAYMEQQVKPGDVVSLTLKRGEEQISAEVPTVAAGDQSDRSVFGISVQNELHLDIPREIEYERYMAHIGGPSHGAMLTLAIIDQLTPSGVTNGWRVAGTGTIEADGSIGAIGGIKQKAYAVSRTDADVFFVPARQLEAAQSGAPELRIVGVRTIDDVLDWLDQNRP